MGFAPQLSWDGTGGTYVMRGAGREPLAAFKPRDEEPFAPNNPRGLPGKMGQQGIHGAIPSGEAHVREVVAYRLDHGNFASVPLTLQAEAVHPAFFVHSHVALSRFGAKVGSLQAWVASDDVAANLGCATFPTREVHKIGEHSKALALIWYRALTWYSLRLSSPRTHFEPWKAVGTRGRGSLAAR